MSEGYEAAFAEEVQEEAILAQSQYLDEAALSSSSTKHLAHAETHEAEDSPGESSPLLLSGGQTRKRQRYERAGASYQRAINEPWTGAYGSQGSPWYKKPHPAWLLPALFPYCMAVGGIMVPRTYLIQDLICKKYFSDQASKDPTFQYMPILVGHNNTQCDIPEISGLVAIFNTYQSVIAGILSAVVSPYLGALSDRIGRKRVLVSASMVAILADITTIIVGRNPDTLSVYWLLLGSVFDGLCGSFTLALALAFAYGSDCTAPEKRAIAFGRFHAVLFTGFALGPLMSGAVIKATGAILTPFYVALGCHIFYIVFTALIVPESLSKERQIIAREQYAKEKAESPNQSWLQTIRSYNIFAPLWILWPTGDGSSPALRCNLFVLAAIDTMLFGVGMGAMVIITTYLRTRFHWDAVDSSLFMSTTNIVRVTGLLVIPPVLTKLFRDPTSPQSAGHRGSDLLDLSVIRIAVIIDFAGYLGYALAPTAVVTYLAGILAALGGFGSPTLASALTKHVPAKMTGQILGASGLLHSLSRVVAPVILSLIYYRTVKMYAGFVFLCLAGTFVITLIMSMFLKQNIYLKDQSAVDEDDQGQGMMEETS